MKHIRYIRLMLGFECNLRCSHCSQQINEYSKICDRDTPSESLLDFIELYSKEAKQREIVFHGGEPLVYYKKIKKIIEAIKKRGINNVKYSITTNGVLFNEEMYEYFTSHKIEICLSYDCVNPNVLRDDVLSDNALELLKKYKYLTEIATTFCAQNYDIVANVRLAEKEFPNANLRLNFPLITCKANEKLLDFKKGQIEKEVNRVLEYDVFSRKVTDIKTRLLGTSNCYTDCRWSIEKFKEMPLCQCGTVSKELNFDLDGNLYICHDTKDKIGHISEGLDTLRKKGYEWQKKRIPQNCYDCKELDRCRSRCIVPQLLTDDGKEFKVCSVRHKIYDTVHKFTEIPKVTMEDSIPIRVAMCCSNMFNPRFKEFYVDKFGILSSVKIDGRKTFKYDLPKVNNTPLFDAIEEHAKELGAINLAWSGGVDSTMLLSVYAKLGIPIKLYTVDSVFKCQSNELKKFVKDNFEWHIGSSFDVPLVTCSSFDSQFTPAIMPLGSIARRIPKYDEQCDKFFYCDVEEKSFEQWIEGAVTDDELKRLQEYVKLFGKPLKSNMDICLFVGWCFTHYANVYSNYYYDLRMLNTTSFYDTQVFNDISWTQYWGTNHPHPSDKTIFKNYIKDVFGTDFSVESNSG